MKIKIITDTISTAEAKEIGKEFYDDMVKGAVDIKASTLALGGEYHIDASRVLESSGAHVGDIWGFNIVFGRPKEDRLEYTALINIRPAFGNRDMYIQDGAIRSKIKEIVDKKVL